MSIRAKTLIKSRYAQVAAIQEYIVDTGKTTIIDKFTATNTSGSTSTLSIYIVPAGSTFDLSNQIIQTFSLTAGLTKDFSELQNQILEVGVSIYVVASVASAVVIRASGREIS